MTILGVYMIGGALSLPDKPIWLFVIGGLTLFASAFPRDHALHIMANGRKYKVTGSKKELRKLKGDLESLMGDK